MAGAGNIWSLGTKQWHILIIRPRKCHLQTHIKTLKNREVNKISSCFAIFVGTALVVGFENQQGMLPLDSAADVPEKSQSENGRS